MNIFLLRLLMLLVACAPATIGLACGKDTNCELGGGRHYRIIMPDGHDGSSKIGAIVWSHGYRGSAAGMMKNTAMIRLASELGVALVATKSYGGDWRIPGTPSEPGTDGHIEFEYFDKLAAELEQNHNIDLTKTISSGFSAGGMMVWNLICHRSNLFAAYVPISGTFWEPTPQTCDTPPANVVHIHGDDDPVVPLTGRPIASTRQGNVPEVLSMYANYGGYSETREAMYGKLNCRESKTDAGEILHFCLFKGGHSFGTDYIRQAWKMLQENGAVPD